MPIKRRRAPKAHIPLSRRKKPEKFKINVKKRLQDPTMKSLWNKKLSTKENMANLSIGDFAGDLPKEFVPTKPRRAEMQIQVIMKNLIEKHADDYEAMKMDKQNVWQWSAGQLKKRITSYLEFQDHVKVRKAMVADKIKARKQEMEEKLKLKNDES